MDKKYVYLFELDSVRKTDKEIIIGQKTLYNEIVKNGNTVVLTFNQLTDSRAFFCLFDNKNYYDNIIELFNLGAIKISQFGENRTVVQYLLNAFDEDNNFYFSAIPIKRSQKRLMALIRRSLEYSDLSEINEYMLQQNKTDTDITELFEEYGDGKPKTNLTIAEMKVILNNLYFFLSVMFRLSSMNEIYISPRAESEISDLRLKNILDIAVNLKPSNDLLWSKAVHIIKSLPCFGENNRSDYQKQILDAYKGNDVESIEIFQYAEAIVNVSYNYACEISVCNISKHYNFEELKLTNADEYPTFSMDFFERLKQDWNCGYNATSRYLIEEDNRFKDFESINEIPDFSDAVVVARITEKYTDVSQNDKYILNYENGIKLQQKTLRKLMSKNMRKNVFLILGSVFIILTLELLLQSFQNIVDKEYEFVASLYNAVGFVAETIAFLIISEIISSILSVFNADIPSLSEMIIQFKNIILRKIRIANNKFEGYKNKQILDIDVKETKNVNEPIRFVIPKNLKKYVKYYKRNKNTKKFAESNVYPVADVTDKKILQMILKEIEINGDKYGICYESPYNLLVVDPILHNNTTVFPYERILSPKDNDSVVIIPQYKDKLLLLKQFRHSIRDFQLCFPRGYAEDNETPVMSAVRELREEIGIESLCRPMCIGEIYADSGLAGNKVSVYIIELDSYTEDSTLVTEGIEKINAVTREELEILIKNGEISDGFTLSAYTLYTYNKTNVLRKEKTNE